MRDRSRARPANLYASRAEAGVRPSIVDRRTASMTDPQRTGTKPAATAPAMKPMTRDHFTDAQGNVYRREDSNTQRYENGRWSKVPATPSTKEPTSVKPTTRPAQPTTKPAQPATQPPVQRPGQPQVKPQGQPTIKQPARDPRRIQQDRQRGEQRMRDMEQNRQQRAQPRQAPAPQRAQPQRAPQPAPRTAPSKSGGGERKR